MRDFGKCMQIELDTLFGDYVLQPELDVTLASVRSLFAESLWLRLLSKSHPSIRISTLIGKAEVAVATEEITEIIREDLNSRRQLPQALSRQLNRAATRGCDFVGVRDITRYGGWVLSGHCSWGSRTSQMMENPRFPLLLDRDLRGVFGNLVVMDAVLNSAQAVALVNPRVSEAASTYGFQVPYLLTDRPYYGMEADDYFLPAKATEPIKGCFERLMLADWHPYVRVVGTLEQDAGRTYLAVGMVFARGYPTYPDVQGWSIGQDAIDDTIKQYTGKGYVMLGQREQLLQELTGSPTWPSELDRDDEEYLFLLYPSAAYLVYKHWGQSTCPSPTVSDTARLILTIGRRYYETIRPGSPAIPYIDRLIGYF